MSEQHIPTKEEIQKRKEEIQKIEKKRKEEVNNLLSDLLNQDQIDNYNRLGEAISSLYGMVYTLEQEGILKAFGEEGERKIKEAVEVVTEYTQKGLESDISKETAVKVRERLIEHSKQQQ